MPTITRTGSNDIPLGAVSDNTIHGGTSNDCVDARNGDDILVGNRKDIFVYNAAACTSDSNASCMDVIPGLTHGDDNIDLCALLGGYDPDPMTHPTRVDMNQLAWGFQISTAGGVWFGQSGGNTLIHADGHGNAATSELCAEQRDREGSRPSDEQVVHGDNHRLQYHPDGDKVDVLDVADLLVYYNDVTH
jgi:Ca2+-binding RTX toxin-like protein